MALNNCKWLVNDEHDSRPMATATAPATTTATTIIAFKHNGMKLILKIFMNYFINCCCARHRTPRWVRLIKTNYFSNKKKLFCPSSCEGKALSLAELNAPNGQRNGAIHNIENSHIKRESKKNGWIITWLSSFSPLFH